MEIIKFFVKNSLIVIIILSLSIISFYEVSPVLFKALCYYYDVGLEGISISESLNRKTIELEKMSEEIDILRSEKNNLIVELKSSLAEKEGLVKGIEKIKLESTNWWTIILTISGITVVGVGIGYYLFISQDGEFFKPIIENIANTSLSLNDTVINSIKIVNENIIKLNFQIENIDIAIQKAQNSLDLASKKE